MSWNVLGVLMLMVIIAVIYPFIHRIPQVRRFMSRWYFWTTFGLIFLGFNLAMYVRLVLMDELFDVYGFHSNPPPPDSGLLYNYNAIFSMVFFLSISSLGTMFLPLSLIFNPTRKIASYLAPVLVLAGFLALLGILNANHAHEVYDLDSKGNYTFMGVLWNNDAVVIRHLLLFVMSYLIMFNVPKYKLNGDKWYRTDTFKITIAWVSYHLYTIVVTGILYAIPVTSSRAGYSVNGLFPRDWGVGGEFEGFKAVKNLYPLCPIVLYVVIIAMVVCKLMLFNKIKTYKTFEYKNPDYWYIKSLGGPKHKWWQW